ncbi:RNA-binding protein of the Puf family,translational repressor [Metarhizium album ARSEF 1941]|uniref:RNA-binding protein of the Puf family,translational repressor n=1 Tax=Metarhizium album (strain ARSEF 1941) TaxID=1081103 RepID=A0A0B2WQP6_METAS|nr:RNA-binding protein of the Puf family,translational repressor [Metarhizium album ARSEF 1941]KHN95285.1 RNA-binding protein of the Puf family,translational repressor [Metarhizium album ARSEF 1941]
MAARPVAAGKKRKATPSSKGRSDSKKARVEESKAVKVKVKTLSASSDDFSDSDPEGGGVGLDAGDKERSPNRTDSGASGNAFDRTLAAGLTSRESHAKQKQLAQERKAAKPLADEVQRTKKIWERLRRKSHVPKEERQKLVEELFGIITGRCRDFVLKHDAVRAVQTAIKYATPDQRRQIARELEGSYAQLAESKYAKFLIGKLLVHQDDEIRDLVIPNFYGKVRKLINHPEASWILDDIYRTVASKEQKATLLREWYGPEFSIKELTKDAKPTADLKEILAAEPSKRGPIRKTLLDMINSLVQKRMTGFTMLHDAMLQYFVTTQPGTEEFSEFVEMVKGDETGDLLKNMAFTKSGARLSCLLLAYGSAKDRKQYLKAYKDTLALMSGDQHAHTVILTAYDVIDDTKLTAKSIFPELVGEKDDEQAQNIVGAANNPNARTTFLYLFEGLSRSLFPASHSFDHEVLKQVHEIRKTTSKKDANIRQQELIAALSPQLLRAIEQVAADLTSTAFGCQFITDVLLSGTGDKTKALEAIAQSALGDPKEEPAAQGGLDAVPHISATPFGGRMLKSLIQGGRFDKATGTIIPADPPLNFSDTLYPVVKDYIIDWATGPSSFVVVGLLESNDFGSTDELKRTLERNKQVLEQAAVEMTPEQKAAKDAQEDKPEKGGKKGKKRSDAAVGNVGSKILLGKL